MQVNLGTNCTFKTFSVSLEKNIQGLSSHKTENAILSNQLPGLVQVSGLVRQRLILSHPAFSEMSIPAVFTATQKTRATNSTINVYSTSP